jgi:hypothetical protein
MKSVSFESNDMKGDMMHKALFVLALMVFTIGGWTTPSAIQAQEDTATLASDMPVDTALFATLRTDASTIETLDALLAQVGDFVPLPVTMSDTLNGLAMDAFGTDFDESMRPWLGDSIAIGLQLNESTMDANEAPLIVVVEITDAEATRDFLTSNLRDFQLLIYEEQAIEGGIQFVPTTEDRGIATITITENRLILSAEGLPVPLNMDTTLADTPRYSEALNNMPEDDYNALIYVDVPAWVQIILDNADDVGDEEVVGLVTQVGALLGTTTLGFTVLDGDTLTMDVAQMVNAVAFDAIGVDMPVTTIDPAFANNVPADAPIVVHAGDYGDVVQSGLNTIYRLQDSVDERGGWAEVFGFGDDADARIGSAVLDLDKLIGIGNVSFSGLTGMSLQRDVLPRIGDMALFVRVLPEALLPDLPITPDLGIALQTSAEDSAFLFDNLITASEAYDTGYVVEDVDGGRVMTVTALSQLAGVDGLLDLQVGAGDDVLVMGTRNAVANVLAGGASLAETEDFQHALTVALPEPNQVAYIATAPIADVLLTLADGDALNDSEAQQLQFVANILPVLRHSTLSTAFDVDNGVTLLRGTITLGER